MADDFTLSYDLKRLRAMVIRNWCGLAGVPGVVCFSCGNASRALKQAGLYVVEVAPFGDLQAGKWWLSHEIKRAFPQFLDATSGHLPLPIMADIAEAMRATIPEPDPSRRCVVPTGSGESIVCLSMAFPDVKFVARYNDSDPATTWSKNAPLNNLVISVADEVQYISPNEETVSAIKKN